MALRASLSQCFLLLLILCAARNCLAIQCLNHDNSPQNMVHSSVAMGFPGGSNGKESACNVGGMGLTPGQEDA